MVSGEEPPLVRELKRGTAGHLSSQSPSWFMHGGKYARPFALFTYVFTAVTTVAFVALAFPEKDEFGRDHVFSPINRYLVKRRDEFFEVDKEMPERDASAA